MFCQGQSREAPPSSLPCLQSSDTSMPVDIPPCVARLETTQWLSTAPPTCTQPATLAAASPSPCLPTRPLTLPQTFPPPVTAFVAVLDGDEWRPAATRPHWAHRRWPRWLAICFGAVAINKPADFPPGPRGHGSLAQTGRHETPARAGWPLPLASSPALLSATSVCTRRRSRSVCNGHTPLHGYERGGGGWGCGSSVHGWLAALLDSVCGGGGVPMANPFPPGHTHPGWMGSTHPAIGAAPHPTAT